ncbi:MAG: surface lipoprotein assembly modifier [Candidatus Sedimenticola sp. PURPLELP]
MKDDDLPQYADPLQVIFLVGMESLIKQDYPSAVMVFTALSKETDSARVKLELARALFLDRQYSASRERFFNLLHESDLPWAVQENIRRYLKLIDNALGSLRYSLSPLYDTNPLNYTDHKAIYVAGGILDLVPPSDNDEVYGMSYSFGASKAFTDDASVGGYFDFSFRDLEGSSLDRVTVDTGISLAPRNHPKIRGKIGFEESYYGGEHSYSMPYGTVIYSPDSVDQFRFSVSIKLGKLDVHEFDYLDAYTQGIDLRASKAFSTNAQAIGHVYVENADTDEKPYSYRGAGIGLDISFPIASAWGGNFSGSIGARNYLAIDPVFGEKRKDITRKIGLTLYNRQWTVFGMVPEFGLHYEERSSSLDFYEYDKMSFILRLKCQLSTGCSAYN